MGDQSGSFLIMAIEEEIAQTIAEALFAKIKRPPNAGMVVHLAAAIIPLVRKAQAEAAAEVLAEVAENADELQHTREEVRQRIYEGYSVEWSDGYDAACGDIAKWARRCIEQNSEGSET